ncbi:MAG: GNAT family N-acetyltransferase [Clostridiales bacterium]|nr:GNAT family N-acetyltransferase [Clostridiales bacterium]
MTNVYLIRHAEAEGNLFRRVHGHYNSGITENGYRQIERLRDRFSSIDIDAVYSSDLARTKATARAVSEPKNLEIIAIPELREINLGKWEDLTWGELLVSYPAEYDLWSKQPDKFNISGGETHFDVYRRMKNALDTVVKKHSGKNIALVSHGAAIRALICGIMHNESLSCLNEIGWCDNTAVSLISADDSLNYKIEYINDNSHLNELSTLSKQVWWRKSDDPSLFNLRFIKASLPDDLNKLLCYYKKTWDHVFGDDLIDLKYAKRLFTNVLNRDGRSIVFAYRNSEELGVIILDPCSSPLPEAGHVSLIFLEEKYRGMGFGAQLIGHAVSVYRSMNKKYVSVRVSKDNAHALHFYGKLGFKEHSREKNGGFTQILLTKSISLN